MSGISILMNPERDRGMVDLCRRLDQIIHHKWKFLVLQGGLVMLVVFKDSGIVDHPMREAGGHESGKAELKWHERNHEILGLGDSPGEAAENVLAGGRGARLRGKSILSLGDGRKHLVFENLDTGRVMLPGAALH